MASRIPSLSTLSEPTPKRAVPPQAKAYITAPATRIFAVDRTRRSPSTRPISRRVAARLSRARTA